MEVKYDRCCGIDVHKKTVVACVIVPGAKRGEVEKETRTYATMAEDLGALLRHEVAGYTAGRGKEAMIQP
jgi:transposase